MKIMVCLILVKIWNSYLVFYLYLLKDDDNNFNDDDLEDEFN